ncbi:hypothetical protein JCGZ_14747 [Jatropha curcas]|uniref:Uncharacterized protein n=1 Tax=Jatropha curcas TaxID=180498 RepID=A0A067K8X8_JATCU|nr:hypothetical protein JCGZ_14747 [Jatropha curcas]
MPLKQKARKKNDGSSSLVPIKKDLASKYKVLFPIYTREEGERFKCLMKSSYTGFEMGQKLHTIQKEHKSMARKWMSYFRKKNIKFTPSPSDSPKA